MTAYIDDVAYWVDLWEDTREPISDTVARKIADYWAIDPDADDFDDQLAYATMYARTAGFTTIVELHALKAWLEARA